MLFLSSENHLQCRWFQKALAMSRKSISFDVDTVGRNKKVIEQYIRNQLQQDYEDEQLSIKEYVDPFTGEPVKEGKK